MALIQLHEPGKASGDQLTYLDLTTGQTGHLNTLGDYRALPGYERNAILATNVPLKLNVARTGTEFDEISFREAKSDHYEETEISELSIPAGKTVLIRVDAENKGEDARYFKVFVRKTPYHTTYGNAAFSSEESTLEIEELVKGRVIWPLTVILADDRLAVLNAETQRREVEKHQDELLFTLRPESYRTDVLDGPESELRQPATPAEVFFNNPFPIAKVEFMRKKADGELEVVKNPRWIENVEIASNFSKGYVNSTYLIRTNAAGRDTTQTFKFTVYLVDRALSIEDWDPEVIIDEH